MPLRALRPGGQEPFHVETERYQDMSTTIGTRFKTGQTCPESGRYCFDGYLDGNSYPAPTAEERQIPLSRLETFPPIRSASKGCWWRLVQHI